MKALYAQNCGWLTTANMVSQTEKQIAIHTGC